MNGYEFYKDLTYYSRRHFENAKNVGFIDIRKGMVLCQENGHYKRRFSS